MGPIAAFITGKQTLPTANREQRLSQRNPVEILGEKVYQATVILGRLGFMPFLDRYTHETTTMMLAYREMLKSPVVKSALLGKIYSVASLDLQMVPASDLPRDAEIADFVSYALQTGITGGIPKIAETVLLHGLLDKHSVSEKVWHATPWPRGRWAGKRMFRDLKAKDRVQLLWDPFRNITGVRSVQFGQFEIFDPAGFVIFKNVALFEGPGMSDMRAVYAPYWMLDTVQKLRMLHLEKFTSPYFKGTYRNGEDREELAEELEKAKSRSWVCIPEDVQLEAMNIATRGEAEFAEAVRDFKEDIALAISGAFLQMLTSSGGGKAELRGDSKTQKSTSELFVWALATKLSSLINTQMVPDLVDMNYGAGSDYPTATLGGINDQELIYSAELDDILANKLGIKLSKKATLKRYSRAEAETPQDMLTPPMPALIPGMPPPGAPPGSPPVAKPPLALPAPPKLPTAPPGSMRPAQLPPPTKTFSESELAAGVVQRVEALTEKYGPDTAKAVIQATAKLLKKEKPPKPHEFSEPPRRDGLMERSLELSIDQTRLARKTAADAADLGHQAMAATRAESERLQAENDSLRAEQERFRQEALAAVAKVAEAIKKPVKKTILYDDDGRVTGMVETPG